MSLDKERNLEKLCPWIQWREPLRVESLDNPELAGLACRYCIAIRGLHGSDIDLLPKTREEFDQHMRQFHPNNERPQ